ncbi:MAG: hypothetical protein LBB16_02960, partial [Puniceicoccales bacterium]|nr:hypothetical protein [Puniceicoccales bacterium]
MIDTTPPTVSESTLPTNKSRGDGDENARSIRAASNDSNISRISGMLFSESINKNSSSLSQRVVAQISGWATYLRGLSLAAIVAGINSVIKITKEQLPQIENKIAGEIIDHQTGILTRTVEVTSTVISRVLLNPVGVALIVVGVVVTVITMCVLYLKE